MRTVQRRLAELSRPESLRLLEQVPVGRIVYTVRALPAIVPVRHLVDNGVLVVRSHVGAACAGSVVAYQADHIDLADRTGWSVTVTGVARRVLDPDQLEAYESSLCPLVDLPDAAVVRIDPEIVRGYAVADDYS